MSIYKRLALWLSEALFPPKCLICKKEGAWLCVQHKKFKPAVKNEVELKYLDAVLAATKYYDSPSNKVVEFFKFKGFRVLGKLMAQEMQSSLLQNEKWLEGAVLVPIPLHWTRRFWRGFNQAEILTQEIQTLNPKFKATPFLKRKKRTKQQAKLKKQERLKNLEEAFFWEGLTCPSKIILIDDVVASGETLESAAKALRQMGAETVVGLVFARGGKD